MSSFTTALIVQRRDAPREWEVYREFIYEVGELGSGVLIIVPAGTVVDFASIPRVLWWLWPPQGGPYDRAAALHDYLYRTCFNTIARVVLDAIFLDAMTALNRAALSPAEPGPRPVSWITRTCLYLGVRLGGWWTIRAYRRAARAAVGLLLILIAGCAPLRPPGSACTRRPELCARPGEVCPAVGPCRPPMFLIEARR